ncbi:hypothetical protein AMECASPLE_027302 [Ameca splendens]|uniref:Uncharacterized protein n=1 Tax=Ameca splendens TaxID=208324 RepID=A0ABV0ZG26_9TELE
MASTLATWKGDVSEVLRLSVFLEYWRHYNHVLVCCFIFNGTSRAIIPGRCLVLGVLWYPSFNASFCGSGAWPAPGCGWWLGGWVGSWSMSCACTGAADGTACRVSLAEVTQVQARARASPDQVQVLRRCACLHPRRERDHLLGPGAGCPNGTCTWAYRVCMGSVSECTTSIVVCLFVGCVGVSVFMCTHEGGNV